MKRVCNLIMQPMINNTDFMDSQQLQQQQPDTIKLKPHEFEVELPCCSSICCTAAGLGTERISAFIEYKYKNYGL